AVPRRRDAALAGRRIAAVSPRLCRARAASYMWAPSRSRGQERSMRTGAEYRRALRDGRRVWVMGEGFVDDLTTHPATRAMVDEYAAWYDLHFDPAWEALVLGPPDPTGARTPWAYTVPSSADDLSGMGRFFS